MIETEAYSVLCQTSKMEITIFKRSFLLEVFDRPNPEYVSVNIFQLYPKNTLYC